ncbi:MAG: coniferyl aldehyde dehydrogenase [Hellea sp.]|jgi:coniferyl-aldehyde dehydrogenase|nr:coniferyl aldehyde dehydrogenase [Hellea sp.]MBT4996476.1 coniferyl aldehyde dehydrogenase [Hellea sp.]MBT5837302.1 coniferyl aldehyde dehydrogenase [Hellea sp.]
MVRINPKSTSDDHSGSIDEMKKILSNQKALFINEPNIAWLKRKENLKKLGSIIKDHESDFINAISKDFGNRASEETIIAEMLVIQGGINHALKHTPKWMRTRKAPTALQFKPAYNRVIPQPLGVIGIMSPWNYPLQLAVMPLIGALGAGNRAMIKPSEYTPLFSKLLKKVLGKVFSEDEVYVALGGVDVATCFSSLHFDHLIFTGSTNVGRIVAKSAAANLVPCTLELGGKSPAIIDESANLKTAVARLTNAKLLNAGQTCVAPDYLLMPKSQVSDFASAMISQAETFYPEFAGNKDYTSIIADSHYARLQNLLEDAENKGAKIRVAGNDDKQQLAKERRIPLTIVTETTPDMKIMQEEIFGPLLPILESESLNESLEYISKRDRPLALYWFGKNKNKLNRVLKESISGGVTINDATWHVIQEDIPFGGVGPSGMGAYHGEVGFRTFSHMKGVFFQSKFSQGSKLHPPYGPMASKMINLMKKIM